MQGSNAMNLDFIKGKFTEPELEKAIVTLFERQNYTHVIGKKLHRKYEEILLKDDLREYLANRYSDLTVTEIEKTISRIENISSTPLYQCNRETFLLLNEGFDLQRDDITKHAEHIEYINFDEPDKNIFKVVSQLDIQGEILRTPDIYESQK
jgi:type I restriction enzyme R subunit